jgi:hypothetical protein
LPNYSEFKNIFPPAPSKFAAFPFDRLSVLKLTGLSQGVFPFIEARLPGFDAIIQGNDEPAMND